jgi:hypothetical protein
LLILKVIVRNESEQDAERRRIYNVGVYLTVLNRLLLVVTISDYLSFVLNVIALSVAFIRLNLLS